jgi:hypothetical protein
MRISRIVEFLRCPRIRGHRHCSLLLRSRERNRIVIFVILAVLNRIALLEG